MRLPGNADAEHIAATYADGVLSVKVPLTAPEPSERKIEVRRGESEKPAVEGGKGD